ncbi:MAG TPA: glucodextranase DOMON-like domain-containing protein [Anaeromyxobacteraceae bacterium]|nr:glucodextranase DOMON-like domain-containing protein [Anaeromyxobacteraceae bacterium]
MGPPFRLLPPALVLALGAIPGGGLAAPRLVASFQDPAGDATGPGSYAPPGDTDFQDGDFDLRRFAVYVDGDDVVLEVTLGAPFRRPELTVRSGSTPLQLWNGIYLQNVDVYVDTDPGAAGFSSCIPGRRVAFADGRTWKAAVVLTPQPGPARNVAADVMGPAARHVVFAQGLQTSGRTVTARVPAAALGGEPRSTWGWSVQVSGARWERSFSLTDRFRGGVEADAFTMPVLPLREAWAFGGAPAGNAHPRVVDVLLPPGVDQKAVLGSFDAATGAFARVPFVYAEPPPPAPPLAPSVGPAEQARSRGAAPPALTVADVSGDMVSISGPPAGIKPMQLGRVLGPDGATVARIVVVQVLDKGLVASAVDGREKIERGARVEFERDPPR